MEKHVLLYIIFSQTRLKAFGDNKEQFLSFHKFLFNYHLLIPGKRNLTREEAELILKVEFAQRNEKICEMFIRFMEATNVLDISYMQWLYIPEVFEVLSNGGDCSQIECGK